MERNIKIDGAMRVKGPSVNFRRTQQMTQDVYSGNIAHFTQVIGTSSEEVHFPSGYGQLHQVMVKNLDPDNFVTIGTDDVTFPIRINAGESCVFAPYGSALYAIASTAPCLIEVVLTGRRKQTMMWVRNRELDNLLTTVGGIEFEVVSIDTVGNTITLNALPLIPSLLNPEVGKEWALLDLENIVGADPLRTGDYTEGLTITGGIMSTKTLTYTVARGDDTLILAGHRVLFFNPKIGPFSDWPADPLITKSGVGWRQTYVQNGPVFQHSDGSWVMLVNGDNAGVFSIGAFSASSLEGPWTPLNGDAAIFLPSGTPSHWAETEIFASGDAHLQDDGTYLVFCSGYSATTGKWTVGYITFDEDFVTPVVGIKIIDDGAAVNGYIAPSVVRWVNNYFMYFIDRDDNANPNLATNGWSLKIAQSDGDLIPASVYTLNGVTVCTGNMNHNGSWRSSHVDAVFAFVRGGVMYLLVGGTSWYKASGNRGNRVYGLFKTTDFTTYEECQLNPIMFNPAYGNDFWADDWGYDHCGGYPFILESGGYFYIFFSANDPSNDYAIGFYKVKIDDFPFF